MPGGLGVLQALPASIFLLFLLSAAYLEEEAGHVGGLAEIWGFPEEPRLDAAASLSHPDSDTRSLHPAKGLRSPPAHPKD